jgi:hypothetical protein
VLTSYTCDGPTTEVVFEVEVEEVLKVVTGSRASSRNLRDDVNK